MNIYELDRCTIEYWYNVQFPSNLILIWGLVFNNLNPLVPQSKKTESYLMSIYNNLIGKLKEKFLTNFIKSTITT